MYSWIIYLNSSSFEVGVAQNAISQRISFVLGIGFIWIRTVQCHPVLSFHWYIWWHVWHTYISFSPPCARPAPYTQLINLFRLSARFDREFVNKMGPAKTQEIHTHPIDVDIKLYGRCTLYRLAGWFSHLHRSVAIVQFSDLSRVYHLKMRATVHAITFCTCMHFMCIYTFLTSFSRSDVCI